MILSNKFLKNEGIKVHDSITYVRTGLKETKCSKILILSKRMVKVLIDVLG